MKKAIKKQISDMSTIQLKELIHNLTSILDEEDLQFILTSIIMMKREKNKLN